MESPKALVCWLPGPAWLPGTGLPFPLGPAELNVGAPSLSRGAQGVWGIRGVFSGREADCSGMNMAGAR